MPAGDVFGLDGFFLNKSNPVVVSTIGINSTGSSAGITVVSGVLNTTAGIATLTLSTAAGLSTTPFYTGAKIAVSGVGNGYNGNFVVTGFAGTTTVSYATTGYVGSITTPLTGLTGTLALLVTNTQITNTTWSSAQTHGLLLLILRTMMEHNHHQTNHSRSFLLPLTVLLLGNLMFLLVMS